MNITFDRYYETETNIYSNCCFGMKGFNHNHTNIW